MQKHSQDNMPPPEASSTTAIGPERCSLAEQDKGFKTAIMNMFKDLKEDMNKHLNKDWEKHSRYKSTNRFSKENPD